MPSRNKKRIGVVTSGIDENVLSGPAFCQKKLLSAIIKINDPEIDLFLIHFKKDKQETIYQKAKEIICPKSPISINRQINNLKLDIVHINHITYKWPTFYFLPVKKVITIHGDASFVLSKQYLSKQAILTKNLALIWHHLGFLKKIDKFVAVSQSTSKIIQKNLRLPENKIIVIYNGIDNNMRFVKNAKKIAKHKWNIDAPFILNVNNFALKKNIVTLIDAFALIKSKTSLPIKLVLAGKGIKENPSILEKIKENKIKNEIIFLNYIKNEELPILYSASEALVNPTLHETFGLPNLKAMACGCPVITSNVFAVPEVVNSAALLIDNPNDVVELYKKIKILLEDKKLSYQLRKKSPLQAQKFSWEKTAREFILLYKSL